MSNKILKGRITPCLICLHIHSIVKSDVSKIKNVHKHKAPIKTALEKKVDEAKRTRNYLDKMEVAFKSYLICRSAGFEGSLDVNVNRNLSTASFDTNLLESLGVNIISGIIIYIKFTSDNNIELYIYIYIYIYFF